MTERIMMLQKRIDKYPAGKVHILEKKNGKTEYYLRMTANDKSGKYISQKQDKKIQGFLQKRYDEEIYRILKIEKDNLERFLRKSNYVNNYIDYKIQDVFSKESKEIKSKIMPIDVSDEDYITWWMSLPYDIKPISQDAVTYETDNKEMVRSKSELNIANTLRKMGVPYRYEKPLRLYNGCIIHPDFTLLDVKNRKEIYWEHRGMMDDMDYSSKSVKRIKLLNKSGIIIGFNLIITEETKEWSLGTDEIEAIVRLFC